MVKVKQHSRSLVRNRGLTRTKLYDYPASSPEKIQSIVSSWVGIKNKNTGEHMYSAYVGTPKTAQKMLRKELGWD
jgi:hypothetical protein